MPKYSEKDGQFKAEIVGISGGTFVVEWMEGLLVIPRSVYVKIKVPYLSPKNAQSFGSNGECLYDTKRFPLELWIAGFKGLGGEGSIQHLRYFSDPSASDLVILKKMAGLVWMEVYDQTFNSSRHIMHLCFNDDQVKEIVRELEKASRFLNQGKQMSSAQVSRH